MVKPLILALSVTALWSLPSVAQNYSDNALAQAMVEELVTEEGFDRAQLEILFSKAERQQSIIDAMSRPAEKTKPWYEYREIFLTEKREREGREFYARHRDTLERAEAETGVPAEIIVAIIGVETFYGRITGSYRVMDALSTLAFDYPQRSAFFTKELKNYLLLTRDQGMDPMALKGSYAGAMGYGQFMPSSYRSYAVDFDGDGKTDIWNNPVDAIGSVANYFVRHGWLAGAPVVSAASLVGEVPEDWFNASLKPEQTVAELDGSGLKPVMAGLAPDAPATAIRFELENGYEYWMGLHNFYVITRYNHSSMYAMSVYQLSQRIARGMQS
ncbi:lytic murein transglycosylase B [Parahaliea maris]|uniref:Lytic murein transglycosylase B n=1 Tax=Parahaliea maris TaxID=2716870 RepID=A0A5C9AB87_9GAMM|nr:lytic murein transglycosylase B [Parahaliea maris]TXS96591.1 lytic murein transglycosylase B [Parahaliea maris]